MNENCLIREEFDERGRTWMRGVLSPSDIAEANSHFPTRERPGSRVAVGSAFSRFLFSSSLTSRISSIWPDLRLVRLLTFDKSPDSNWGLPWHQDRVIAVKERCDVEGFTNWTRKDGIWHCEPPAEILETMLFVRLYLDPVSHENGGMEWALESHKYGVMRARETERVASSCQKEKEIAQPGDALVLSMLTLHRSVESTVHERRRVIRLDYGMKDLPAPLQWAY